MKEKSFIVLSFFICFFSFLHAQSLKIGVISDLHYMAPSLLVEKGSAFDHSMRGDRKLLKESAAILKATVDNLLNDSVHLVLITGDLTKDGELVSHEGVVEMLQPLLDKGIKVLVVPGNHDINNPHACAFYGDSTQSVATVSAADFRKIYEKYGFGTAISTDTSSLSYVSEPVEGLRILCIDDCEYDNNTFRSKGDPSDSNVANGVIKPETMQWILKEINDAKVHGKQIIGMMHHNVVEHFDYEASFPGYMTDNSKDVQQKLMTAGLNTIFTGHFHATDIARADDENGNHLYDVETGSIVTYPCPYRLVGFAGDSMKIETRHIETVDVPLPDGVDFQTYARREAAKRLSEVLSGLIDQNYQKLSASIPPSAALFIDLPDKKEFSRLVSKYLLSNGTDLVLAHYCGNENLMDSAEFKRDELLGNIDAFVHDFSKESSGMLSSVTEKAIENSNALKRIKAVVNSIWNDRVEPGYPMEDYNGQPHVPVDDLNLVIHLPKNITSSF